MASPAFILCSLLLLSAAFVDASTEQLPPSARFGIFDKGKGILGNIGSTVSNGLDKAKNITAANPIVSGVGNAISSGKDVVSNIGSSVSQTVTSGIDSVKDVASSNPIVSGVSNVVSSGKNVVSSIGSSVGQTVSNGIDSVKDVASSNPIVSGVGNAISSGKDVVSNIGSSVSQTVTSGIDSVKDVASSNPIVSGVGNAVSGAVSSGKDVASNIGQGINNGVQNIKDGVQNVKDVADSIQNTIGSVVNGLKPGESQGFVTTIQNILRKVMQDMFSGKTLPSSIVDRTIEETSKMDSKIAYGIRVVLLKIQELQRGEKIEVVGATIAKAFFDKYSGKIKALDETLNIVGQENLEMLIGKIVRKLKEVIEKRVLKDADQ